MFSFNYFSFTTAGRLLEVDKEKKNWLSAGTLIYHHNQEPHYNTGYSQIVSSIHIDIGQDWFKLYDVKIENIEGSLEVSNPVVKQHFYKLWIQWKTELYVEQIAAEESILRTMNVLSKENLVGAGLKPAWVSLIKEMIHDLFDKKLTLTALATEANIHPAYLCQQFPLKFGCSMTEYIRKVKVEKAAQMLIAEPSTSLSAIAYDCGFADQSHFSRVFKNQLGLTPLEFRLMNNGQRK